MANDLPLRSPIVTSPVTQPSAPGPSATLPSSVARPARREPSSPVAKPVMCFSDIA